MATLEESLASLVSRVRALADRAGTAEAQLAIVNGLLDRWQDRYGPTDPQYAQLVAELAEALGRKPWGEGQPALVPEPQRSHWSRRCGARLPVPDTAVAPTVIQCIRPVGHDDAHTTGTTKWFEVL
jgi:hypothetical protein